VLLLGQRERYPTPLCNARRPPSAAEPRALASFSSEVTQRRKSVLYTDFDLLIFAKTERTFAVQTQHDKQIAITLVPLSLTIRQAAMQKTDM
jgi:phosphopantothenate synthetase